MARRDLKIFVTADSRGTVRATAAATKGFDRMKGAAVAAGGALAGGLALGAKKAFEEFREAEKVTNQTNAALKSTRGAAKVTAKEISGLANAISLKAGIDDEAIQSGENLLLTFTKIRNETGKGNDIFSRATKTIVDMSVSLDQDLKSSAIQVGKALNDPVKGMTALQRVGVSFTQDQKDRVAQWVEEGKTLKAQRFILKELTTEFGGSAAAQADASDKLKVAWENMFESIGTAIGPTVQRVAATMAKFINQMQTGQGEGGRFAARLKEVWEEAKPIVLWFGRAALAVGKFAAKHPEIVKVATAVGIVAVAFNKFRIGTAVKAVAAFTKAAIATPGQVRSALSGVKGIFTRVFGSAGTAGGTTAAERAASGVMGSFPTKEGRMKATTRKVMTNVGKAGGVAMAVGVIAGLAGLSAAIGNVLHKAKTDVVDPWVHRHFGKAGDVYTAIRDFIGSNLPSTLPGAPLLKEIFGKGAGKPIVDFLGANFAPFGGHLGNASASLAKVRKISLAMGLSGGLGPGQGFRPGDDGWHGAGRALDNSGPPAAMMRFAQLMAAKFGSRLLELIYTPLGFSIKNGKRVAPYAQADHYDHVHVALQKGGLIPGRGVGDKVPVLAEPGEGFINKRAVRAMGGPRAIDAINRAVPRFQQGGTVPKEYRRLIGIASSRYGIPPRILAGLIKVESGWNPNAVSPAGAFGLTQFMPSTASSYGVVRGSGHHAVSTQILGAAHYLNALGYQDDPRHALAAYNGGPGNPQYGYAADVMAAAAGYAGIGGRGGGGHRITEDSPRWNWLTMGNRKRSVVTLGGIRLTVGAKHFASLAHRGEIDWRRTKHRRGDRLALRRHPASRRHVPSFTGGQAREGFMGAFADDIASREALAALTPETADDLAVAQDAERGWQAFLELAQAKGDKAAITTAATNLRSARDRIAELSAPAQSQQDLVDAIKDLKDSIDAQNAIANSVAGIGQREALKAFADVISGQIGGQAGQRGRSAGDGVTAARY